MNSTPERMTPEAALAVLKAQQSWIGPERPDDDEVDAERWDRIEKAHATLAALAQRVESQDAEIEQLRVQLAGCGVAAMCNTRESLAQHCAIKPGDYGWSASFGDCVRAAEREIAERERADALEKEAGRLRFRSTVFDVLIEYIDRMNDLVPEDDAERVLGEFLAAVNPVFDAEHKRDRLAEGVE